MLKIYIAGPLTKGPRPKNINTALQVAIRIRIRGHLPFVPHLFELWDLIIPQDYEFWMQMDFEWIKLCDVLIRIPGESSGADREVELAKTLNIPVFYGLKEFMESQLWVPKDEERIQIQKMS